MPTFTQTSDVGHLITSGSFKVDKKFTTALMEKPGATNVRRAPPWSIAETEAPLALYLHSGEVTTIAQAGSLATHNPIASQNGSLIEDPSFSFSNRAWSQGGSLSELAKARGTGLTTTRGKIWPTN